MRSIFFVVSFFITTGLVMAQKTPRELQSVAREFNNRGDHDNAVVVLLQGLKEHPDNLELQKDLAFSLILKRDFAKAKEVVEKLIKRGDADVASFQLAGNVYKALEEVKDCEKMYRQGLKKFPSSGPLYSELGELYFSANDGRAIECWEDGIRLDPNYAGNYYNAALHYATHKEPLVAILYAETFINMESKSQRAITLKSILWESYKNILSGASNESLKKRSPFWIAVKQTLENASGPAINGLTPETLTMIRTRFILDWFEKQGEKYPCRLFDHQRQLLQSGLFEAYDQWLIGEVADTQKYKSWTQENAVTFLKLKDFLFNRVYKVPTGQYYPTR
jgi:tetratricopeptide (TPR) repeat protein